MRTVETNLYQFHELRPDNAMIAVKEYKKSFYSQVIPIEEVWFTFGGFIYPIFN